MARSKSSDSSAPAGTAGTGPGGASPGRKGATAAGATAAGKGAAGRGEQKAGKPAKAPKLGKDGKPKVGRIKRIKTTFGQIRQAYTLTYKNDRKLPWYLLITFVVAFAVVELIAVLLDSPLLLLPLAIMVGLLAALVVFGRRAQGSAYRQVDGQPGAAAWVLEGMRGDWRVSTAVAGTPQLDSVHRVLGRPGIVLVGEGSPQRVRGLIAQEKKKIARVVGETPIYDVSVGDEEGQVPLKKLSSHVMKLPRNLSAGEVNALGRRMSALGGPKMPIPGGPLPGGKQMSISQRQVRRR
ncbi:DUF4191 family protein [Modestobacter sp. I12A-02628]|uniref:DUF4191 family protein n=1 Tax=Goekera deserti TaxID=2497753 RepID=A0A7K3WAP0_9ACTN|nr:DUF4191 domain-containing protein [Goekera deserti]MPQ97622.1 DUF4191 family protein [Goekera deserti]NDI47773.1 DUF4191 family protein [Goekera deserti]NEL53521.1 DUF4191 family protein [Goekera deserti]